MSGNQRGPKITRNLVTSTLGNVSDSKLAAVLATGATVEEFEKAVQWASRQNDVMGELEKPLSGRAAAVYDILTAEQEMDEP